MRTRCWWRLCESVEDGVAPAAWKWTLVAHCGEVNRGSYVHSLVLTDIRADGPRPRPSWSEKVPLRSKHATASARACPLPESAGCGKGGESSGAGIGTVLPGSTGGGGDPCPAGRSTLEGLRDHALLCVRLTAKGRKERICPLWPETVLLLKPQPRAPDQRLFVNRYGEPLSATGVRLKLATYVKAAAETVPSLRTKHVTPHSFRRATASTSSRGGSKSRSSAAGLAT